VRQHVEEPSQWSVEQFILSARLGEAHWWKDSVPLYLETKRSSGNEIAERFEIGLYDST
jgi:hypothetical protein